MSKKIRTEAVDSLFEAILSLQDKEECYAFFEEDVYKRQLPCILLRVVPVVKEMLWHGRSDQFKL